MTFLIKRSISLAGHRTSIALEPEFWEVLDKLAQHQKMSFAAFVTSIDASRPPHRPLSSALRIAALHANKTFQEE
ncbi:ribbon-helix-helix domain-containing protein [Swingsia samuiensis]|uniref:Aryl-sulfate sulfotransferase n=1 Tax=Swingsia samuiensis TaxID=1293412 RepID=A0A4Y6UJG6_9PROT|nr:ribbon-helix-helix domain-containing protein [Swingsia samuiensis]QDH17204.1 aryl-sulfate sulfotransferase [Swingsia samuiensis]